LFHHHTAPEKFDEKILEQSDEGIGRNLFVKRVPIDKFFDKPSQLKFNVASKDGILLVDAGEKEYEADIYYWSNGKYRHDPVDY